jgi:hypothetical protein
MGTTEGGGAFLRGGGSEDDPRVPRVDPDCSSSPLPYPSSSSNSGRSPSDDDGAVGEDGGAAVVFLRRLFCAAVRADDDDDDEDDGGRTALPKNPARVDGGETRRAAGVNDLEVSGSVSSRVRMNFMVGQVAVALAAVWFAGLITQSGGKNLLLQITEQLKFLHLGQAERGFARSMMIVDMYKFLYW